MESATKILTVVAFNNIYQLSNTVFLRWKNLSLTSCGPCLSSFPSTSYSPPAWRPSHSRITPLDIKDFIWFQECFSFFPSFFPCCSLCFSFSRLPFLCLYFNIHRSQYSQDQEVSSPSRTRNANVQMLPVGNKSNF